MPPWPAPPRCRISDAASRGPASGHAEHARCCRRFSLACRPRPDDGALSRCHRPPSCPLSHGENCTATECMLPPREAGRHELVAAFDIPMAAEPAGCYADAASRQLLSFLPLLYACSEICFRLPARACATVGHTFCERSRDIFIYSPPPLD